MKTSRWHIIKDGIFVDYQTTRDQAHLIGQKASHGCSYADNWASIPFQRMPNVSLEPGAKDLTEKDIIGATDDGIYIKGDSSYSIDHQRYNFQFSGQTFWEVKNGQDHHPAARRRLPVEHAGVLEVVRPGRRQVAPTSSAARSTTARASPGRATRSATAVRSPGSRGSTCSTPAANDPEADR